MEGGRRKGLRAGGRAVRGSTVLAACLHAFLSQSPISVRLFLSPLHLLGPGQVRFVVYLSVAKSCVKTLSISGTLLAKGRVSSA